MRWGERSCKNYQKVKACEYQPTMPTCNNTCSGYVWDGKSKTEHQRYKENIPDAKKNIPSAPKKTDHRNDKKYLTGNIRKNRRRNFRGTCKGGAK